jgi:DNA-binding response OmpR family regulator
VTAKTGQRLKDARILIVDDDEDILSSIELAVRAEGALTQTATDGHAAVHAVQTDPPDAVVLDMMLPRLSGLVVLEKIKQMEEPPIVVMVTANQGKRHMSYAESLDVDAYMTKPVPLQRLVDTLARLLEEVFGDDDDEAEINGEPSARPDAERG